jgi:hypothetical protein
VIITTRSLSEGSSRNGIGALQSIKHVVAAQEGDRLILVRDHGAQIGDELQPLFLLNRFHVLLVLNGLIPNEFDRDVPALALVQTQQISTGVLFYDGRQFGAQVKDIMQTAVDWLGILPLSAHMVVLYIGMMSMITPPVAIAAFVAANMAAAHLMRTGFEAVRIGSLRGPRTVVMPTLA